MKIRELQKRMGKKGIGCSLIFNFQSLKPSGNFLYLTGFSGIGILKVMRNSKPLLYVPEPEYHIAKREVRGITVVDYGWDITKVLKEINVGSIGMDHAAMTLNQSKKFHKILGKRSVDISDILKELRSMKDNKEAGYLRKAVIITEKILDQSIKHIKDCKKESDLYAILCNETFKRGLRLSFDPIVASGKNSGKWHHVSSTDRIVKGFMIIDFGVRYKGYAADLTRTVYVGRPSRIEILEYDKVRTVLYECENMLMPGKPFKDIQEHAKKRLGDGFVHAIGHGIGLDEHESPFVGPDNLVEGNTLAIEPAVYVPYRYGIRIEKDYVLTKDGFKRLSGPPSRLVII